MAHPSEVVSKGDKVTCVVLNVDQERKRIALGLKQMNNDPWEGDIPGRYKPGEVKKGKVTKLTNFGVFVELEPGLEGLLHISELADHKVESPEDVVKVGDEIEVKVLRVDAADRKIGLSRKQLHMADEGGGRGRGRAPKAETPPSSDQSVSCAAAPARPAVNCSPSRQTSKRSNRRRPANRKRRRLKSKVMFLPLAAKRSDAAKPQAARPTYARPLPRDLLAVLRRTRNASPPW